MTSARADNSAAPGREPAFDVLVVGGGMVGASLGCALGATRLRVAVVEAVAFDNDSQPSFDERTVALTYGSRRIFEGIGVWADIARHDATPILRIHVSDRGHGGVTHLDTRDAGEEALGYVVPNRVVGAALMGKLRRLSGTLLLSPSRVTNLAVLEDRVRVTARTDGGGRELDARLLVIADGGDAFTRRQLDIRVRETPYDRSALVTTVTSDRDHNGSAYERFTANGPLALLPVAERGYAVVWTLPTDVAEQHLGLESGEFCRRLQVCFGDRAGRFEAVGVRRLYPLALSRIEDPVRARTVVIGNAAHTVHPVAGQGFNLGLRDVATLADVLSDAVTADGDIGSARVLHRYAARRRRDTAAVTWFTHGLVRIFSSRRLPMVAARNLGLLGIDVLPPLKRGLLRRTMGLSGRQSRLGLGLPLGGED